MTVRVAIVGGGITGLSTAYELRGTLPDAEIVVHEASPRAGGKVVSSPFAGRVVDEGADAFLARVPWALDLCRELGLESTLVSPAESSAYVWWDGALRRLPAGHVLGVPTDLDAVRSSGIVTEPIEHVPWPAPLAPGEDVAVGEIVRAQFGDAVFERLVDPLVGGINAGDGDHLSLRAVTPQLAAAAERDASLLAGLGALPAPAPGPVFYAPAGGMAALVEALVDALRARAVDIRTGAAVTSIDDLDADAVVITTPAYAAADLVRTASPEAAAGLASIPYASVALVTMAFPAGAAHRALDGSGYLVPRPAGLLMTACSWATSKWAELRAADDRVLVRASVGRFGDERFASMSDDELVTVLREELATTSEIAGEPDEVRVTRWMRSFPQYEPGHLDRIFAIETQLSQDAPRVVVQGAAFRGLGVPACIRQGREAAVGVAAALAASR